MEELIHRLLDGKPLSEAESRELLDWLRASEAHRRTFVGLYRAWGESHADASQYDGERAYRIFAARLAAAGEKPAPARKPLLRRGVRIAAAAMICLAIVSGWFWSRGNAPLPDLESFIQQTDTPDFTGGNVELLLPGGAKILLSEKNPAIRYDGSSVRIKNHKEAISVVRGETPFNQLLVPFGRQSHLTLSDGTRIWVNAGSKLVYPTLFHGDTREIHVDGEVYMEVAHDPSHPFIVHSGTMNVKVLGTKFYLSSYGEEHSREVVLLSGAVSVASTLAPEHEMRIAPDQQAVLGENGRIDIHDVAARNFIAWIDGFIRCDNERLGNILDRIARHYNCRIDRTAAVAGLPISGKLELQPDVESVLRVLSLTAPIRVYRTESDGYSISLTEESAPNPNL